MTQRRKRTIIAMQPLLHVRDIPRTIAFYTEHLDFIVHGAEPEDAPTWCGMHSGNARMMFSSEDQSEQPRFTGILYLYVDDVDEVWQRLKDAVPILVGPPFLTPYGMREFTIADPDGYALTIGEPQPYEEQPPA